MKGGRRKGRAIVANPTHGSRALDTETAAHCVTPCQRKGYVLKPAVWNRRLIAIKSSIRLITGLAHSGQTAQLVVSRERSVSDRLPSPPPLHRRRGRGPSLYPHSGQEHLKQHRLAWTEVQSRPTGQANSRTSSVHDQTAPLRPGLNNRPMMSDPCRSKKHAPHPDYGGRKIAHMKWCGR